MQNQIDLRGLWRLALGEKDVHPAQFEEKMILPGTTETAGIGHINPDMTETKYLSRIRPYTGAVWFERVVHIPDSWNGKCICLELERTKFTTVWVDGVLASASDETIVPQRHDLTLQLTAGDHVLMICVDNDLEHKMGFPNCMISSHQYTDHTQTNWNGIIGYLRLSAYEAQYMSTCKAIGDAKGKQILLTYELQNSGDACTAVLQIAPTRICEGEKHRLPLFQTELYLPCGTSEAVLALPIQSPMLWDEFCPAYYDLVLTLTSGATSSTKTVRAAFKNQEVRGKHIILNEAPIYLRGTVDCAIFPKTGHGPTTVTEWIQVLSILKDYGLNHYRYHSWCPVDAAFEAADRLGMYIQVELPNFGNYFTQPGDERYDAALNAFLADQAHKLLVQFGNHPSFFIFAVGNEMRGSIDCFKALIDACRAYRMDILYAQGSNNFFEDPQCISSDDCWITMRTSKTANIRASFSHKDRPLGYTQLADEPSTLQTYDEGVALSPLPLISHEVGQYQVFPQLGEMDDYTGPLYPTVLPILRDDLDKKGLLHLSDDFVAASGKLAVDCYREDIESLLRTEDMSGFQLLGLQDFPGQGTAMVGVLDSFFKTKNLISPQKWRQFCSAQVIMAKFAAFTHFAGDELPVELVLSNFGMADLCGVPTLELWQGEACTAKYELQQTTVSRGCVRSVGQLALTLPVLDRAVELEMRIALGDIHSSYPLWVYPRAACAKAAENVLLSSCLSEREREALRAGKNVVVFSANASIDHSIEGFYTPDFWCWPMFSAESEALGYPVAPGTMGLLIDADHPLFDLFPTRGYTQQQWHTIAYHARPLIMDAFTPKVKPIVRVIDNFSRNHDLALIFEANVENGKLLFIASDVLAHLDKPQVCMLHDCAVRYAASMDTAPNTIAFDALKSML